MAGPLCWPLMSRSAGGRGVMLRTPGTVLRAPVLPHFFLSEIE